MNSEVTQYKVLVVDDSPFMRRLITDLLESDSRLKVIGTAYNGEVALKKIKELNPDVITLDVEMPVMDGIKTLKALKEFSTVPAIMFSSRTKHGAETTIKALELGAFDFVQKPDEKEGIKIEQVKHELTAKIIAAVSQHKKQPISSRHPEHSEVSRERTIDSSVGLKPSLRMTHKTKTEKILVIGASTGGPGALKEVVAALPEDFPAKILIVQHMPPKFTEMFAQRLNNISKITVMEAKGGEIPEKGKAYLAPGNYHMVLDEKGKIALNQNPQRCGVRPAVDATIESVSKAYGKNLVCVILTGMGHDGTEGVKFARENGAICIAEHESTCIVYGMPRSIVDSGNADVVAPLHSIPEEIMKAL